jgi:hypothetical protein
MTTPTTTLVAPNAGEESRDGDQKVFYIAEESGQGPTSSETVSKLIENKAEVSSKAASVSQQEKTLTKIVGKQISQIGKVRE